MAQHMRLKHPKVTYIMADLNPNLKEEEGKLKKEDQTKVKKEIKTTEWYFTVKNKNLRNRELNSGLLRDRQG